MKLRKDRRLCRTCVSYHKERYEWCAVHGVRVAGYIGGRACWLKRRARK